MEQQFLLLLFLIQGISADVSCEGLGIFRPEGPFDGWPDPTCPEDPTMDLTFRMFAGLTDLGDYFDENDVPPSFDPDDDTIFIVHGWLGNTDDQWMEDMKDMLRDNSDGIGDKNIVLVNWSGEGGSNAGYLTAASTTRTVGAKLAQVMMNLVTNGIGDRNRMHCVGHSLGAHICGHCGRWVNSEGGYLSGRITGLDPAGPQFANNPDRTVGLYRDCALFVDVIHTDRTLGSTPEVGGPRRELGHQDFYPNDGTDQPGCATDVCNHMRVIDLFSASITNGCFVATERCGASNNLIGSCVPCETDCAQMGYFASDTHPEGLYNLQTGGGGTFC